VLNKSGSGTNFSKEGTGTGTGTAINHYGSKTLVERPIIVGIYVLFVLMYGSEFGKQKKLTEFELAKNYI
jgi:hypothetical protein